MEGVPLVLPQNLFAVTGIGIGTVRNFASRPPQDEVSKTQEVPIVKKKEASAGVIEVENDEDYDEEEEEREFQRQQEARNKKIKNGEEYADCELGKTLKLHM